MSRSFFSYRISKTLLMAVFIFGAILIIIFRLNHTYIYTWGLNAGGGGATTTYPSGAISPFVAFISVLFFCDTRLLKEGLNELHIDSVFFIRLLKDATELIHHVRFI